MKKRLETYLRYLEAQTARTLTDGEREALRADLLCQIAFFSHERLVHLLVTLFFGLFTLLSAALCLVRCSPAALALSAAFLVLLIPYVIHYYRLENGVQRLYTFYDALTRRPG